MWRLVSASTGLAAVDVTLALVANQSVSLGIAVAAYGALPSLMLWVAVVTWSGVLAANHSRQRPLALLCPTIPIVAFAVSWWAAPYVQLPQDYSHFHSMRALYNARVAQLPNNGSRFAEFNWGGMLFASKGVVYDQTDEVALPYWGQSAEWKDRMRSTDLTCGYDGPIGEVMPLGDHYYIVTFGC